MFSKGLADRLPTKEVVDAIAFWLEDTLNISKMSDEELFALIEDFYAYSSERSLTDPVELFLYGK